jgi:hypothetical protein
MPAKPHNIITISQWDIALKDKEERGTDWQHFF